MSAPRHTSEASLPEPGSPRHLIRPAQGKWISLLLAVAMHVLLAVLLFVGVQWQRRPPEPVAVDLIASLPPPAAVAPQPHPEPPRVELRPEPEPPKPAKPDITIKAPEKPKPKPKEPPKPPPKTEPKPAPKQVERPKQTPKAEPKPEKVPPTEPTETPRNERLDQMLRMEQERARAASTARQHDMLARETAAAGARTGALNAWVAAIQNHLRPNIRMPATVSGRPVASFRITLTGTGMLIGEPVLEKSSGDKTADEAMRRGIIASAPLPLPASPDVFQRELIIIVDPLRNQGL